MEYNLDLWMEKQIFSEPVEYKRTQSKRLLNIKIVFDIITPMRRCLHNNNSKILTVLTLRVFLYSES